MALELNFTTTMISSASTNSVISRISQNRKLWNQMMLSITGAADSCRSIPTARAGPIRRKPFLRPRAQRLPPLIPATDGPFGPSTSSCRSRSLDRTSKHSAGWREMLHDPPPDKRPWVVLSRYWGRIVRTRRNPASQTIILRLSQCSSGARSDASRADAPASHFPVKSGKSTAFAAGPRLTAELPDVRTDSVLHRNLIRAGGVARPGPSIG